MLNILLSLPPVLPVESMSCRMIFVPDKRLSIAAASLYMVLTDRVSWSPGQHAAVVSYKACDGLSVLRKGHHIIWRNAGKIGRIPGVRENVERNGLTYR